MVATNEKPLDAGTAKYPGAVALTRYPASAGFRGADHGCYSQCCTGPLNLYYASQWQVVEERWNGTTASNVQYQYVRSAAYVNGMVLRDTYVAGTVQPDLRVYTATDANYNVTALVGYNPATQTWGVVERFVYSPYGTVTVLSPVWTVQADAFNWQYLYQGGRQDAATGLYLFQHRNYSPSLGTWVSQDPAGYINGANTYQFVTSDPVGMVDPSGLRFRMSASEMASLARDVEHDLRQGGTGAVDGWKRRPARNFVGTELRLHGVAGELHEWGVDLLAFPVKIWRFMSGEWTVQAVGKTVVKGGAKFLVRELLRRENSVKSAKVEQQLWSWSGTEELVDGKKEGVSAQMSITYNEETQTFTGLVYGAVGAVRTDGLVYNNEGCSVRLFRYRFEGAITTHASGVWGFYWLHSWQVFGGIAPGSWRFGF